MANSHENTRHTRLPVRTAVRVEMLAEKTGTTRATAHDIVVEEYLRAHHPEIIAATLNLPEPRRALPAKSREG